MAGIYAAVIAAIVATFGYVVTARSKLLEDRRKTYAAALGTVLEYQGLPHRIRRRPDPTPATRGTLGAQISNLQRDMEHYVSLMDLDSDEMGRAYRALVMKSRMVGRDDRESAWNCAPAISDKDMSYPE